MIHWIFDYLQEGAIVKLPLLFSSLVVLLLCIWTITTIIIDHSVAIWLYSQNGWFQLSYPNFRDKVVAIKYIHYVVNRDTGEIIHVNKKSLRRLKNENLIGWDYEINCYYFNNTVLSEVKELTKPKIIIWDQTPQSE
jgi:hypothetical protein